MFKKKNPNAPKKDNKQNSSKMYLYTMIGAGAALFATVLWVVLSSTRSITAVVPAQTISPGTTITSNMLKKIQVPANTPAGYITDENSLIGQKVKTQVDKDQMLYANNVQTSFNMFGNNVQIPKNYVLTNINIPNDRAVDGLISAGDCVDIAGIPNGTNKNASSSELDANLGGIAESSFGAEGIKGYWVLGNVKILQSFKSQQEEQSANKEGTENTGTESTGVEQGSYIVALSYSDYKKLLIAEQYLDLHMSLTPKDGYDKDEMNKDNDLRGLENAQKDGKSENGKSKDKKVTTEKSVDR